MKTLGYVVRVLARTWRTWLCFEGLFQLIVLSLIGPGTRISIDAAMAAMGYAYLTWETVFAFLLSPLVILIVLVGALLIVLASVFNLAGLHYVLAFDEAKGSPRLQDALRYGLQRISHVVRPQNFFLVPYLLFLLQFTQIGLVGGVINTLDIPEFIMEYVEMNPLLSVLYIVVALVLTVVTFRFVYATVYFVADKDITFTQAARQAREAGKGHLVIDMVRIILVPLAAMAIIGCLVFAPFFIVLLASQKLMLAGGLFASIFALVSLLAAAPISYATSLALLAQREKLPASPEPPVARAASWVVPTVAIALLAAAVVGGTIFFYENVVVPANTVTQLSERGARLTAHRGGTFAAPENTMVAFKQAKQDGADVCEIDVQQSLDGVIFVSHDSNFMRVSGVDKGAWELTWDEISKLDATGDVWANKVEKQSYPLLDEVIDWASKNDMLLNIELKPTGHETDFEKSVVDIVHAHDFVSRCVVTSQAYDTVKRVKEYDANITCVYVMTFAYGEVWRLDAADAYSIEATNATPALVSALHAHGKEVYAWVVNYDSSINRMVLNGVDDIITDDVRLGRTVISDANELDPISRWLNTIAALLS